MQCYFVKDETEPCWTCRTISKSTSSSIARQLCEADDVTRLGNGAWSVAVELRCALIAMARPEQADCLARATLVGALAAAVCDDMEALRRCERGRRPWRVFRHVLLHIMTKARQGKMKCKPWLLYTVMLANDAR